MILAAERKLADFISPPTPDGVLEASGVIAKGADYYVVFDNVRRIARIHRSLEPGSTRHAWFGRKRDGEGYEDIAFSRYTRRFYLLIEAEKHPDGTYKALIDECDESAQYKRRRWIDLAFEKRNTGFEGLSAVRWRKQDYLLALCEGNRCRAGRAGRKPGGGRIHLLQRSGHAVEIGGSHQAAADASTFEDYSAVALRGRRIAVLSQQSARLWIGTLRFGDWTIADEGKTFEFPRTRNGKIKYRMLEGLCWLTDRSFVCRLGPLEAAMRKSGSARPTSRFMCSSCRSGARHPTCDLPKPLRPWGDSSAEGPGVAAFIGCGAAQLLGCHVWQCDDRAAVVASTPVPTNTGHFASPDEGIPRRQPRRTIKNSVWTELSVTRAGHALARGARAESGGWDERVAHLRIDGVKSRNLLADFSSEARQGHESLQDRPGSDATAAERVSVRPIRQYTSRSRPMTKWPAYRCIMSACNSSGDKLL